MGTKPQSWEDRTAKERRDMIIRGVVLYQFNSSFLDDIFGDWMKSPDYDHASKIVMPDTLERINDVINHYCAERRKLTGEEIPLGMDLGARLNYAALGASQVAAKKADNPNTLKDARDLFILAGYFYARTHPTHIWMVKSNMRSVLETLPEQDRPKNIPWMQ